MNLINYIRSFFKETLIVKNDLGILNNRFVINFKDAKIAMVNCLKIAMQRSTGNIGIIDLKISVYTENELVKIKDFKNSMKILSGIKKYNKESFDSFLNKFFNSKIRETIESELKNEDTWLWNRKKKG